MEIVDFGGLDTMNIGWDVTEYFDFGSCCIQLPFISCFYSFISDQVISVCCSFSRPRVSPFPIRTPMQVPATTHPSKHPFILEQLYGQSYHSKVLVAQLVERSNLMTKVSTAEVPCSIQGGSSYYLIFAFFATEQTQVMARSWVRSNQQFS